MKLIEKIKHELRRHFTIMLIPHNTVKPVRLSFSLSFLLFMLFLWTGITIWAGFLSGRHIDYWRVKADNQLMNLKVKFFAQEVKKSQEYLEQIKENDTQVRSLLEMKSKKAIIESETNAKGGPTQQDVKDLERLLAGKIYEMSQPDMHRQTQALKEEAQKRLQRHKEVLEYVETQRALFKSTPNVWPCMGRVTSGYGFRIHPISFTTEFHTGIDIANVVNTPLYATAYGTVKFCDWQSGYGRLIIIEHGHGFKTYYGHLRKILVKPGDKIIRGQLIGLMGDTGSATGYHVHYEIIFNDRTINPVHYLKHAYSKKNKLN
ncbi:MAG: peptidoglycan DD-metalloendopeptidase family protein [Elusimicrobiota bacterium]